MDKAEAIERLEYLKAKAQLALEQEVPDWIVEDVLGTIEAYDMAIEALQTEPNCSEKTNNFDKDINVRSKEEPQTYKINPKEPTNMPKCFDCEDFFTCDGHDGQCEIECEKCKHFIEETDTYMKQCEFYFMECRFEPKDEPQKDCKKCKNYDRCKNNRWKCCVYQPKTEPQTDCAWK